MATDIHAFVEYRDPRFGYVSLSTGELWLYREYELFAALVALFPPRGLPADCGHDVRTGPYVLPSRLGEMPHLASPDEFDPSWLSVGEVLSALEHAGLALSSCQPSFRAAVAAMHELDRIEGANPRLVFYFDR